jgi:hypothetical protein
MDLQESICTRCGADLSLLIRLRQQTNRKIIKILSDKALHPDERMRQLNSTQQICRLEPLASLLKNQSTLKKKPLTFHLGSWELRLRRRKKSSGVK